MSIKRICYGQLWPWQYNFNAMLSFDFGISTEKAIICQRIEQPLKRTKNTNKTKDIYKTFRQLKSTE